MHGNGISKRTQIVWAALVGTMTVLGGVLSILDRGPGLRTDGLNIPSLMAPTGLPAPTGLSNIESVMKTRRAIEAGRWTSIVVHHSGSPFATDASLQAEAQAQGRGGMGYQFVIGNGNGLSDGELRVDPSWLDQAGGDRVIAICLVGNGDRKRFSDAQLARLNELIETLTRRLEIGGNKVYLRSEIDRSTSPGRFFPAASFREQWK